jgi:SH3-like domain-containing protein
VTVKGSPDVKAKDVFLLHEGTKVRVKQNMGRWFEIELADGQVGWILKKDAGEI